MMSQRPQAQEGGDYRHRRGLQAQEEGDYGYRREGTTGTGERRPPAQEGGDHRREGRT